MVVVLYVFRFGSGHITPEGRNKINKDLYEKYSSGPFETRHILDKNLQEDLRRKKYDFSRSEEVLKRVDKAHNENADGKGNCFLRILFFNLFVPPSVSKLSDIEARHISMLRNLTKPALLDVATPSFSNAVNILTGEDDLVINPSFSLLTRRVP